MRSKLWERWPYDVFDTYLVAVLKVLAFNEGCEAIVVSGSMREALDDRGWVNFYARGEGCYSYSITRLGRAELVKFDETCASVRSPA